MHAPMQAPLSRLPGFLIVAAETLAVTSLLVHVNMRTQAEGHALPKTWLGNAGTCWSEVATASMCILLTFLLLQEVEEWEGGTRRVMQLLVKMRGRVRSRLGVVPTAHAAAPAGSTASGTPGAATHSASTSTSATSSGSQHPSLPAAATVPATTSISAPEQQASAPDAAGLAQPGASAGAASAEPGGAAAAVPSHTVLPNRRPQPILLDLGPVLRAAAHVQRSASAPAGASRTCAMPSALYSNFQAHVKRTGIAMSIKVSLLSWLIRGLIVRHVHGLVSWPCLKGLLLMLPCRVNPCHVFALDINTFLRTCAGAGACRREPSRRHCPCARGHPRRHAGVCREEHVRPIPALPHPLYHPSVHQPGGFCSGAGTAAGAGSGGWRGPCQPATDPGPR